VVAPVREACDGLDNPDALKGAASPETLDRISRQRPRRAPGRSCSGPADNSLIKPPRIGRRLIHS
jgi:hypothetical protein